MVSSEDTNGVKAGTSSNSAAKPSNYSSNSSTDSEDNFDELTDKSKKTKKSSIRVGVEFQADLEVIKKPPLRTNLEKTSEILLWKPSPTLSENDLESTVFVICSKFSYSIEQTLSLLTVNNYDYKKAIVKCKEYVPTPDEWSIEDKIIFEQAYNIYGKNFYKIKQCLPDKKQGAIVNFYYMWKKTRGYASTIQKQTEQQQNGKNNLNLTNGELESTALGTNDDQNQNNETDIEDGNFISNVTKICSNCDLITDDLQSTPKGVLCHPCYAYYKNTSGLMRPDNLNTKSGRSTDTDTELKRTEHAKEAKNFQKSLRKPPKGIYLNYEELIHLAKFDYNITFDMLDKKLISLKKEVQTNKQQIGSIIDELTKNYDASAVEENLEFMNLGLAMNETPVWNEHEISMVLQGFSKYGTDFEAISQVMGTKSENSIKSFYLYHKDNYSLEKLVLNPVEIKNESSLIFTELNKLNRSDLPTTTSRLSLVAVGDEANLGKKNGEECLTNCIEYLN